MKWSLTLKVFGLVLLCTCLYLPGIATLPVIDRDEAHFVQTTRQMLESHDYLTVKFQQHIRHLKPPGIYWLQAAIYHALGLQVFTAVWPYRIASFFGALFTVLLVFGFCYRFLSPEVAWLSALLTATTNLVIVESHMALTDAVLLFTITLMQFSLWRLYRQDKGWVWLFWLSMALGIVIKGIAPLFALMTIIGLMVLDKNRQWLKHLKTQWGLPLLLILTCAWLIPLSLKGHSNFLVDMVRSDLLPKLTGGQQGHGMPPSYFLVLLPVTLGIAFVFIAPAICYARQFRMDSNIKFLIAWIVPNWLILALTPTKLPQYLLPVYPAVMILIGCSLRHCEQLSCEANHERGKARLLRRYASRNDEKSWLNFLNNFSIIVFISTYFTLAAAFIFIAYFLHHLTILIVLFSLLIASLVLIMGVLLIKHNYLRAIYLWVFTVVITYGVMLHTIFPSWHNIWVSQLVAAKVKPFIPNQVNNQAPLIIMSHHPEPSLVFALGTRKVLFTSVQKGARQLRHHPGQLLLISRSLLPELQQALGKEAKFLLPIATIEGYDYAGGGSTDNALMEWQ